MLVTRPDAEVSKEPGLVDIPVLFFLLSAEALDAYRDSHNRSYRLVGLDR